MLQLIKKLKYTYLTNLNNIISSSGTSFLLPSESEIRKKKYSNDSVVVEISINIQMTHCRTDEVLTNNSHNNSCNTHTYEQTN